MRILLIDDDSVFLRLMERQIQRIGHSLITAESTQAALAALAESKPDLILVDLGLPGVIGASFIDTLSAVAPNVAFAIITGQQEIERAIDMMHRGALDYLVKDSNLMERLPTSLARIEQHLDRARNLRMFEAAHQESEGRRLAIMNAARDGIIEFGQNGVITSANPAAHRLIGLSEGALIGASGHQFFTNLAHALTTNSDTVSLSNVVLNTVGNPIAAEASFIVANVNNRIYHAVIFRDISERMMMEQEILNISEAERLHFGQELHDGLGQQMAALGILSTVLTRSLQAQNSDLLPQADKISHGISEAIKASRALAHGLAPLGVSDHGLVHALTRLAAEIREAHQIHCVFTHQENVDMNVPEIALHLYRIAQEASTNAIRHGHAKTITFSLTRENNVLHLCISDNGIGFFETIPREGLGLRTMHHRAQVMNARLDVRSAPNCGTQIHCYIPDSHRSSAQPIS
jgi:two-component system, NarL family, sensor histidine kinase UhpB